MITKQFADGETYIRPRIRVRAVLPQSTCQPVNDPLTGAIMIDASRFRTAGVQQ